jgi:hypothetical protein
MKKNIYKHKTTGKKVVTSEKLSAQHWKKIGEKRGAKMESDEVHNAQM